MHLLCLNEQHPMDISILYPVCMALVSGGATRARRATCLDHKSWRVALENTGALSHLTCCDRRFAVGPGLEAPPRRSLSTQ